MYTTSKASLKQLKEPKPRKVSFKVTWFSKKVAENIDMVIEYDDKEDIFSRTCYRRVKGESFLETLIMVLMEHDSTVITYLPQAVTKNKEGEFEKLKYVTIDGTKVEWTPDIGSIWTSCRPKIIECKAESWINGLSEGKKQELFHKWNETKKYADQYLDSDFLVITDNFLKHSWRVDNLMDISSQMPYSNLGCEHALLHHIKNTSIHNWTIKRLQEQFQDQFSNKEVLSSICHLIYKGILYINLDEEELTIDGTLIYLTEENKKEISLEEWLNKYSYDWIKKEQESQKVETDNDAIFLVNEEDLTDYQKKWYSIKKSVIEGIEENLSKTTILSKIHAEYKTAIKRTLYFDLLKLYRSYQDGQINYNDLLKKIIPKTYERGRKGTTLFTVEHNKAVYFEDKFRQVMERYKTLERPDKKDSWEDYQTLASTEAFDRGLVSSLNAPTSELLRIAQNPDKEFSMVGQGLFTKEVNRYCRTFKISVDIKREGFELGLKMNKNIRSTTPYTNYTGQIAEADHSIVDLLNKAKTEMYGLNFTVIASLVDHCNKKKFGGKKLHSDYMERPTISVILDLHTCVILSYIIRYRKPSAHTDLLVLRRMLLGKINPLITDKKERDKFSTVAKIMRGVFSLWKRKLLTDKEFNLIKNEFDPDIPNNLRTVCDWWDNIRVKPFILHTDNGKDLISEDVQKWAANEKIPINHGVRPVGGSQYGGSVERVFRTIQKLAVHAQPGTTMGSIQAKRDYVSQFHAILTFEEVEALFLLAFARYHTNPHSGLNGISPMRKWIESEGKGHNFHYLTNDKLVSGHIEEKTRHDILQAAWNLLIEDQLDYKSKLGVFQGFDNEHVYYNYEGLGMLKTKDGVEFVDKSWVERFKDGEKITVKIDRSDVRFIWWWHPELKKPVQVWASKLSLFGRKYRREALMRKPPISEELLRDAMYFPQYEAIMDINDHFDYEAINNSARNVYYTMDRGIPRNAKDNQKMVKEVEKQIQQARESHETLVSLQPEGNIQDNKIPGMKQAKKTQQNKKKPIFSDSPIQIEIIDIPPEGSGPFSNQFVQMDLDENKD